MISRHIMMLALFLVGCAPLDRDLIVSRACPSAPAAANPCAAIPAMPNPDEQQVDGIDAEFCAVPSLAFGVKDLPVVDPTPPPDLPAHGELRVAWSPGYFHAYAHVVDRVLVQSTSRDLWDGDAVEIFIAPPSASGYDGHYATSLASGGPIQLVWTAPDGSGAARAGVFLNYPVTGVIEFLPADQYAVRRTSDGYAVELRLPWRTAGPPQAGQAVAFDFAVDVTDDAAPGHRQLQGVLNQAQFGNEICGVVGRPAWPACDVRTWCTPVLDTPALE